MYVVGDRVNFWGDFQFVGDITNPSAEIVHTSCAGRITRNGPFSLGLDAPRVVFHDHRDLESGDGSVSVGV